VGRFNVAKAEASDLPSAGRTQLAKVNKRGIFEQKMRSDT